MKPDKITCTIHVLTVLFGIFYMCYVKPNSRQFSNSVLVRRGQNIKMAVTIACQVRQVKTLGAHVHIGARATFNGPEAKSHRSK